MPLSSEEKLSLLTGAVEEMALIGYRLDKLLLGFKLYEENKNTLDIEIYEAISETFQLAIIAMQSELDKFHRLFTYLQSLTKE